MLIALESLQKRSFSKMKNYSLVLEWIKSLLKKASEWKFADNRNQWGSFPYKNKPKTLSDVHVLYSEARYAGKPLGVMSWM